MGILGLTPRILALAALIAGTFGGTPRATAGTVVATISVDQDMSWSGMVLDERAGHLFVGTSTHALLREQSWVTIIDVRSGKMLRHIPVGVGLPRLAFDPRIDRVYATGVIKTPSMLRPPFPRTPPRSAPLLVALDGVTGSIAGTAQIGSQGSSIGVDARLGHLFVAGGGAGWCSNHTCYTEPSIVTMLDARTLKTLAITPVNGSGDLLVDDANHRVYIPTSDGIDVLDARTAKRVLRIPLMGSMLAVDGPANRVFLTDLSGDLLILDGRTSRVVALQRASSPLGFGAPGAAMAVDQQTGHIYYAAERARDRRGDPKGPVRLYEADGATGRVARSCPIAAHPSAVAAAPWSGEVLVIDSGTNTATAVSMAGCRIGQRVTVPPTPSAIAVDAADSLMVIESNTPPRQTASSESSPLSNSTTIAIAALWH